MEVACRIDHAVWMAGGSLEDGHYLWGTRMCDVSEICSTKATQIQGLNAGETLAFSFVREGWLILQLQCARVSMWQGLVAFSQILLGYAWQGLTLPRLD